MVDYVNPEREAFGQFQALDRDGPVQMLNLVKLHDTAKYEDGTLVSGREAYAAYGRESGPIFQRVGGKIVLSGSFELTLIGPSDEGWDVVFVAEYPNVAAFVEMVKNADYQQAVRHRNAAVKTSRLIRIEPNAKSGSTFG